ncbi:MAG: hypothetical protein JWP58_4289, partial [Hymenobacter sp.]|nr:hypothetical protein [Hymenobacter sp.]
MKKLNTILAAASLITASLTACQKDADVVIISPIAGDFLGKEACPPTTALAGSDYAVTIYNQADPNNGKVFIENIYGIGGKYEATVSGNTITVAPTRYSYKPGAAAAVTGNISATGTIDGAVLTLNYKLDGGFVDECKFVGSR